MSSKRANQRHHELSLKPTRARRMVCVFVAAAAFAAITHPASADIKVFNDFCGTGDWASQCPFTQDGTLYCASNWGDPAPQATGPCPGVPSTNDTAYIGEEYAMNISTSGNAGVIDAHGPITLNSGSSIGVQDVATFMGPVTWYGGTLRNASFEMPMPSIEFYDRLDMFDVGAHTITGAIVSNNDVATLTGTLNVTNAPANPSGYLIGYFRNEVYQGSPARFEILGPATVSGAGRFINDGLLWMDAECDTVATIGTTTSNPAINFNNTGEVRVVDGILRINAPNVDEGSGAFGTGTFVTENPCSRIEFGSGYTFQPGSALLGAGEIVLGHPDGIWSQGGYVFPGPGPVVADRLRVSDGVALRGPGALQIGGPSHGGAASLAWDAGSGTESLLWDGLHLDITPGATMSIDGAGNHRLLNSQWDLDGNAVWSGTGKIKLEGSSALTIGPSGTFDMQTDSYFDPFSDGVVSNDGLIVKSGGTGTSSVYCDQLVNRGSIEAYSGTLSFHSGLLQHGGSMWIGDGCAVENWADLHVEPGSVISGPGLLKVDGFLTVPAGVTASIPNLEQRLGYLRGEGTVSVTDRFVWTGSGYQYEAGVLRIEASASASIEGGSTKAIRENRTLENAGSLTWSGTGSITLYGSAAGAALLHNLPGGELIIETDAPMNHSGTPVSARFINEGTVIMRQDSGYTRIKPLFEQAGSLILESALLQFFGGFTQTDGVTRLAGGNFDVYAGIDPGTADLQGGVLEGAGSITANISNAAAVVRPGLPVGSMQIGNQFATRNYVQSAGGTLEIEVAGTASGEYDVLNVTGQDTLDGTLVVQLVNGFIPAVGDSFTVLTYGSRSGTFATIDAPEGIEFSATYGATSMTLEVTSVGITTPGDFDGDGDVDTGDFAVFAQCFGGANLPPAGSCPPGVNADLDDDTDVDTADFAIFAQSFTGAG